MIRIADKQPNEWNKNTMVKFQVLTKSKQILNSINALFDDSNLDVIWYYLMLWYNTAEKNENIHDE